MKQMSNKSKTRMNYILCTVLTVAVTVAAMFLPQAYCLVNDSKYDAGSVTETIEDADTTGITSSEFVTLADSYDTAWTSTNTIDVTDTMVTTEEKEECEVLAKAMSTLADSLKSNSGGYEEIEKAAALISEASDTVSAYGSGSKVPSYGEIEQITMRGMIGSQTVQNNLLLAKFDYRYDESSGDEANIDNYDYYDYLRVLYNKDSEMIYELNISREAENNGNWFNKYLQPYLADSENSGASYQFAYAMVVRYWKYTATPYSTSLTNFVYDANDTESSDTETTTDNTVQMRNVDLDLSLTESYGFYASQQSY